MKEHDLLHIENQVKELRGDLANLADGTGYQELLLIIRKPWFTSVAEHAFLQGVVDSMLAQTKALLGLKHVLISGASKVELNPQPLPPKADAAGGGASR